MFDDPKIPSNLPMDKESAHPSQAGQSGEPDDIFQDIEPAKNSPAMGGVATGRPVMKYNPESMVPRSPAIPSAGPTLSAEIKPPLIASKKVIIILGVILGALVVAGVVFSAIRFVQRSAQDQAVESTAESNVNTDVPALPELPAINQGDATGLPPVPTDVSTSTPPAVDTATLDTDGDGLTDNEEMDLGTDLQNSDSDNDGLFDGEEAQTYKTDPLNPDTDRDGFLDGQEVSNNYNPKGEGKLLEIPAQ